MVKTVTWKWLRIGYKIHESLGKIWYALQNKGTSTSISHNYLLLTEM
jgi:hypothetical protein